MNTLQMNDSKIGLIDFSVKHYCEGKFGMCYIFLLFFVSRLLFSLSLSSVVFVIFCYVRGKLHISKNSSAKMKGRFA